MHFDANAKNYETMVHIKHKREMHGTTKVPKGLCTCFMCVYFSLQFLSLTLKEKSVWGPFLAQDLFKHHLARAECTCYANDMAFTFLESTGIRQVVQYILNVAKSFSLSRVTRWKNAPKQPHKMPILSFQAPLTSFYHGFTIGKQHW